MITIHKAVLPIQDEVVVEWPRDSHPLYVDVQNGQLTVWYECNPENDEVSARFHIEGTGHPLVEGAWYIGSVQMPPFVWHVFLDVEQQ